jgi:dinuclear metal center YbgI/SA1388 family protein
MAIRDQILRWLDEFMEKDSYTDYLPIGLMVEGRPEVRKLATGVSACAEFFEQAVEWGADMILVHHGMFWDSEPRVLKGFLKERVKTLLLNDITLAGYHLPLDAHPEIGNNILFARAMGLRDIEPFGVYKGRPIGWKGSLARQSIEDFIKEAQGFYGTEPIRFLNGPPLIETVGVISGGAWDHVVEAAESGLDCFVTGNADEAVYNLARELKIHFLGFGHYATERVGVRQLGELVAEEFKISTRFFDVPNPL